MKKKEIYTLIRKDIPIVRGKHIISDARVGGEKLVYNRVTYPICILNVFDLFKINVPLILYKKIKGGIGIDIKKDTVVFLRPYKKNWAAKKDRLPFHLWGKKEHPLTNIWLELEFDYQDIMKGTPIIKTRIDNHSLIKFLRQHEEKFVLINN